MIKVNDSVLLTEDVNDLEKNSVGFIIAKTNRPR